MFRRCIVKGCDNDMSNGFDRYNVKIQLRCIRAETRIGVGLDLGQNTHYLNLG